MYLRRLLVMANEGPQALNDALFAFDSVLSGQEEPDERCCTDCYNCATIAMYCT